MKKTKFFIGILILLFMQTSFAQELVKRNFELNALEVMENLRSYGFPKDYWKKHLVFNKEKSFANYISYKKDSHFFTLYYHTADSAKIFPYEYHIYFDVIDNNDNIIGTVRSICRYQDYGDECINMDLFAEDLILYKRVIDGQFISFDKAMAIAKKNGFKNITKWEIHIKDDDEDEDRDCSKILPEIIWTFEEEVPNNFPKRIDIDAYNGKVISIGIIAYQDHIGRQ